jgi:hypothetical protein
VYAQDSATQPDATAPVENRMDAETPKMTAPQGAEQTAPTNRVGEAVPEMKAPDGADSNATATAPGNTPSTADAPSTDTATSQPAGAAPLMVTDADLSKWVGRSVYSSDGKDLGEIAALKREPDGKVDEIHADIGGFLGFGETRVRFAADQIKEAKDDRLVVTLTEAEVNNLPPIEKQ